MHWEQAYLPLTANISPFGNMFLLDSKRSNASTIFSVDKKYVKIDGSKACQDTIYCLSSCNSFQENYHFCYLHFNITIFFNTLLSERFAIFALIFLKKPKFVNQLSKLIKSSINIINKLCSTVKVCSKGVWPNFSEKLQVAKMKK